MARQPQESVLLDADWSRGIIRDAPRTAIPTGGVYDAADFMLNQPGLAWKRGGTSYASSALPSASVGISATNKLAEGGVNKSSLTTSGSLTPTANRLYLATVAQRSQSGAGNAPTLTGGGGLTWVQVATTTFGTVGRVTVFRALKASGLTSGTLTVDFAGQTQTQVFLSVNEFARVDTTGTDGSGAVVQSAIGNGTGTTGTVTFASVFGDATNNAAVAAISHLAYEDTTPESGYAELSDQKLNTTALETEWKTGQDLNPTATWATSSAWGGVAIEVKASLASVAPTYVPVVSYAEFPGDSQLLAVADNGALYKLSGGGPTVNATLGAAALSLDKPKIHISGTSRLIITTGDGSQAPFAYDGANAAVTLAGGPPAAKFAEVYKARLVLANTNANPNRIFFSPLDITTTWDTTNSWLDTDHAITGLAALKNSLLVFSKGHTEYITGAIPPPGSDMSRGPLGTIGCIDARSLAAWQDNVIFANQDGVWYTNGAGFRSLTEPPELGGIGIGAYWRSLLSSYTSSWTIAGGIVGQFYVVSILSDSRVLQACLCCYLPRRSWWRLTNIKAMMFATATGVAQEMYYADASTNRVVQLSGVFTPAGSNKNDADGTAVAPLLETRFLGTGPVLKAYGYGRVSLDMRDAASDNPTMAVSIAPGVEATTFTACEESPFAETADSVRERFTISKDSQGVSVRFQQTNASSKTEVRALEVEERPYPGWAEGQ